METFKRFADQEYKLNYWASIQRDAARKKPRVTASMVFKACVFQAVLSIESVLELDQKGRTRALRELLDNDREIATGSDSTILRAASAWIMEPLLKAGYALHCRLRHQGCASTTLSTGTEVRLAIEDGSCFGGHWGSVLAFSGAVAHVVDMEPYQGRGKELPASRPLMIRAARTLGKGFATHLLYDGLMMCKADFRLARRLGMHLLVKTSEEKSLEIIASSKEAWTQLSERDLERAGVETVQGYDPKRHLRYRIRTQAGIRWEGLQYPLNLAWVEETHLKGKYAGETFSFWAVTTDETLTGDELREMAHNRWTIENNAFKELSALTGSKKGYIKNSHAKEALLRMWFMGLALLKTFRLHLDALPDFRDWGVKKTKKLLAQVILFGIDCEASSPAPP